MMGEIEFGNDAFNRAYWAIRNLLLDDRSAPGLRISIVEQAALMKISATPVREAVSRLAGEGLLEDRRGQGYFVPVLPAQEVAELFGFLQLCLQDLLRSAAPASGSVDAKALELVKAPERRDLTAAPLIRLLVSRSPNRTLARTIWRLLDRLAVLASAERLVIADNGEELERLLGSAAAHAFPALREDLRAWCRRRRLVAARLCFARTTLAGSTNISRI